MNTTSSAIASLESGGWREYTDQFRKGTRCFYKRIDTPTRCHCNSDKDGLQVCIAVGEIDGYTSIEMDIRAELPDGSWVTLHNYGMNHLTMDQVFASIPRLLSAWELLANHPST